MSTYPTPIDISQMPDLVDMVEEVKATNTPREFRRDNKPVAVLSPILEHEAEWDNIKQSLAAIGSWSDIDADKVITDIERWRAEGSRP
jgi:hypothetical protein